MAQQTITGGDGTTGQTGAQIKAIINENFTENYADIAALEVAMADKADLVAGVVPTSQLPSYVDDVIEVANFAALPATGTAGKIYFTLDDGEQWRWATTVYVNTSTGVQLGETSGTAYRGDRGKTAYDHSQDITTNPHGVTKAQVGLGSASNTADADKPVSIATQAELDLKENRLTLNDKVDDYTLIITDASKLVRMNKATALNLTVPLNSSVAYPTGTRIYAQRTGAGLLTIVATGGVTITASGPNLTDPGLNVVMILIKVGTNEWSLQNGIAGTYSAWTPAWAGFSTDPVVVARYQVIGKTCFFWVNPSSHGVSNATTAAGKTMTLPFTSSSAIAQPVFTVRITNNGSPQAGPGFGLIALSSNVMTVYRDGVLNVAWTGSGNCSWSMFGQYEIA